MARLQKWIFCIIICFGFVSVNLAQVLDQEPEPSSQDLYDFHLKKKKENTAGAWVTVGVGSAMVIGGVVLQLTDNIWGNSNRGLVLTVAGVATSFVSIPLFVAGNKHKKAATLQLQRGAVGLGPGNRINYSGISFEVSF